MNKYLVLSVFIAVFFYLLRKDRVYVVPMVFLIFSNLNGLLDWEDFAFHGVIKFQDYGLVICLLLLFTNSLSKHKRVNQYAQSAKQTVLYKLLIIFWVYYAFLFIYSTILHGSIEWPIKMGRSFFYGLIVFLTIQEISFNPPQLFNKIISCLKIATVVFGVLYVAYNLFGFDIYPNEAIEEYVIEGMADTVKRNFAGLPTLTYYFLIYFVHRLLTSTKNYRPNFAGAILMAACVLMTLTRGAIINMALVIAVIVVVNRKSPIILSRLVALVMAGMMMVVFFQIFGMGHLEVLTLRFGEFVDVGGATQSGTYIVRANEFSNILSRVLDFNPLFGFGFTNLNELGYYSLWLHGGSPDNGFSNLIGDTGFIGVTLYILIISTWLLVNGKLRALNKDEYSTINFFFIISMITSMFNGATASYMHYFALFLAYDVFAYSYFSKLQKSNVDKRCTSFRGRLKSRG